MQAIGIEQLQRDAKARYSASEEDREIVICFLDLQAIKEVPKKTQYPETERRVVAHVAQSESENAWILKEVLDLYKRPYPGAFSSTEWSVKPAAYEVHAEKKQKLAELLDSKTNIKPGISQVK